MKGCSPECTILSDLTSVTGYPVTITSEVWSFPNSNPVIPGANQDSIHRCFTNPGCYNVQLVTTTNTGCIDTTLLVDTICVGVPPVCTVNVTPPTMCFEADTAQFTLACDSGNVMIRVIDFGDGQNGIFYSNTFTHVYEDTGSLCATIVVYRDSCAGDTIHAPCVTVYPPIAKFTDSTTCRTGDTIFLVNHSIGATSYLWFFWMQRVKQVSATNPLYYTFSLATHVRLNIKCL